MLFPGRPIVSVYGKNSLHHEVEINWSAIGSVNIEDAKKFRQELDDAIVEAEALRIEKQSIDRLGKNIKVGDVVLAAHHELFLEGKVVKIQKNPSHEDCDIVATVKLESGAVMFRPCHDLIVK